MAARGSGIGASMGGLGIAGAGSGTVKAQRGQPYGPAVSSKGAVHQYLWVLVLLELAALFALRHAFRQYHGG